MELFLPGIASLLIIALIVFIVLPRLGAPVLAILSILLLVYGVMNHIKLFSSEWRYSTWQERFRYYGPVLIISAMILGTLMYIGILYATKGAEALPANNVPVANATEVVNAVNNAVNGAVDAVNKAVNKANNAVNTAVNNAVNSANAALNNKRNNKGVITNLGNILKTPNVLNRKN
jgi:hypothetical protein